MAFLSKLKRLASRGFAQRPTSAARRTRRPSLSVEGLEDRFAPAVYNVIGTGDGLGSVLPTHTPGVFNATTLRAAVNAADANPGGNVINLAVGGTYSLTLGELAILPGGGNLTIQNPSGKPVTINANHLSRVFDINPNFDPANPTAAFGVTLNGLTITGGLASDANNPDGPAASGGGIRDVGNASLALNNDVVSGNTATADGGGISMENTVSVPWTLTLNNSVISNNHAGDAGGGVEEDGSGKVFAIGSVISGNTSVNQGAGIWLDAIEQNNVFRTANLTVTGSLISNNQALAAGNDGGGIGNAGNGAVTIVGSTVANNYANGMGGGYGDENGGGNLTVVNSLFLNNVAAGVGGGIEAAGPVTTIVNSELKANKSGAEGGGLFANGLTLLVEDSTFAVNVAAGANGLGGAGIELQTTGTGLDASYITDSTITTNIALNNAGDSGGGIDASANFTGDLVLQNDTINANYATTGGGLAWAGATGSAVLVENTILAGNFATTDPDVSVAAGSLTDRGGNVIGQNALLAPLGNYGGPSVGSPGNAFVLETEALQLGSPAVGKGVLSRAPGYDERGVASLFNGAIDAGADSVVVPPLQQAAYTVSEAHTVSTTTVNGVKTTTYYVNTTADTLTPPPGVLSLRAALQLANSTPGNKVIDLVVGGTYSLTLGELAILPSGGNVTIQNMSGKTVTINGNYLSRVFDINPDFDPANPTAPFTVTLSGLVITGGLASDPANPDGPTSSGGGIRDVGNASLTLNTDTVTWNLATADGGGISMENTASVPWTLTINNSVISGNHAGDAGGGVEEDGAGKVFVNASVISGNTSVNQGAGIWLDGIQLGAVFQTANLTVTGSLISSNLALAAGNDGGGIGNAGDGAVTIVGSTVANNYANGMGGGYGDENGGGNLTVVNSLFLNNIASGVGGGIESAGPSTTITTSELKGNESGTDGGGLFTTSPTLTVKGSTFAANIAAGDGNGLGGGGIELQNVTTATITNATITGNLALNAAGANGGGIDATTLASESKVVLLNDTINANFAANGGGIFWGGTGAFGLQNTIVAQNLVSLGGVGPDADSSGANFSDLGGNLIGLGGPANGNSGLGAAFGGLASTQVGTTAAINALLQALGCYGGPVVGATGSSLVLEAEPLLGGSPALGKGVVNGAPTTDEIGLPSVVKGKVNVGAV